MMATLGPLMRLRSQLSQPFLFCSMRTAASVYLLAAVVAGASRRVLESEVTDDSESAGAPSRKRRSCASETESRAVEERHDCRDSSHGRLLTRP